MYSLPLRAALLGGLLLVGCDDDAAGADRSESEQARARGAEAGALTEDAAAPLAKPDSSIDASASGDGGSGPVSADAGSNADGETGGECGGLVGKACPKGFFCSQEDPATDLGCGFADSFGRCERAPEACTFDYTPVCGCDGETYGNRCAAHGAGVSVAAEGECATMTGDVSCDDRQGKVLCKRARPQCPGSQVPAVIDRCWGPCVKIEQCVCSAAEECPEHERFICHMSAQHCGPYVN